MHHTHEDPGCFTPSQASDRAALAIGWKVLSGPCQIASARGWSRRAALKNYLPWPENFCLRLQSFRFFRGTCKESLICKRRRSLRPSAVPQVFLVISLFDWSAFFPDLSLCVLKWRVSVVDSISKASWMCFVELMWLNRWSRGTKRLDVDGFPSPSVVTKWNVDCCLCFEHMRLTRRRHYVYLWKSEKHGVCSTMSRVFCGVASLPSPKVRDLAMFFSASVVHTASVVHRV